jgi:hypothetical protein
LVVDEFVGFQDVGEEVPAWSRPNFFALRYELADSRGVLARIGVHGIGGGRHVLAETGEGSWRFGIFPLDQPEVPIWRNSVIAKTSPSRTTVGGPACRFVLWMEPSFKSEKKEPLRPSLRT